MLTVLAETLFAATKTKGSRDYRNTADWANRFQPGDMSRDNVHRRYRLNPYRDLW